MININEEVINAIYLGLGRTDEELVYFDRLKGDVLGYNEEYFSSFIGDQSIENRRLLNKIMNNEPKDFVDDKRYLLIDRLFLIDFLKEFKFQAKSKEPFTSFVDYFSLEIIKEFNSNVQIEHLYKSEYIEQKFHTLFEEKYLNQISELITEYSSIYNETYKSLVLKWVNSNT